MDLKEAGLHLFNTIDAVTKQLFEEGFHFHGELKLFPRSDSDGLTTVTITPSPDPKGGKPTKMLAVTPRHGDVCGECGSAALVQTGSCLTCQQCGWNKGCS